MLFISELTAYIVIGGYDEYDANLATIAQFQNDVWTNVGQLNTARYVSFRALFCSISNWKNIKDHSAQWLDGALIVAGGVYKTGYSEKCTLNVSGQFSCVDILPTLYMVRSRVSFRVPATYCNE